MLSFRILFSILSFILLLSPNARANELLWQTNAGGNDIHIFDPVSGELVERLIVGDNPHGIAWAKGHDTVFVTLEKNGAAAGELLWINKNSFEIERRIEVGIEPHAIAVTPNGRWVYIPCRDGKYWVVDASTGLIVKKIYTGGRPHNTTAVSDQLMILSPMGQPKRAILVNPDLDHAEIGSIGFSSSVRPPALALSRNKFFQHVDGLNGFEVADLSSQEKVARVEHTTFLGLPLAPTAWGKIGWRGLNRCHGLGVEPGDQYIWSVCGRYLTVHEIGSSGYEQVDVIRLPHKGYWLTFSQSGEKVFVALADAGEVAVIDTSSRTLGSVLEAGKKPKRNLSISTD